MEFKDLVNTRRSVRKFDIYSKITRSEAIQIVDLANQAPSWKNSQTARYYFALSDEFINSIMSSLPSFNRNSCKGVAGFVVTSFVSNCSGFSRDGIPDNELGNGWGCYDLGMHDMLFTLAAKENGFDTLIMGIRDQDEIRKIMDIPTEEIIVSVIAIGKTSKKHTKPKRKLAEDIAVFF